MTIETWKQKFYAAEASVVGNDTDVVALRHSIKKWEGLRPGNLERHGLRVDCARIVDVGGVNFHINSESCALCRKYIFFNEQASCVPCPLYKVRGGVACDKDVDGDDPSPFDTWRDRADPEPMLHWLRKALKVATCEVKK